MEEAIPLNKNCMIDLVQIQKHVETRLTSYSSFAMIVSYNAVKPLVSLSRGGICAGRLLRMALDLMYRIGTVIFGLLRLEIVCMCRGIDSCSLESCSFKNVLLGCS